MMIPFGWLQVLPVFDETTDNWLGLVIFADVDVVHPFASVMAMEYAPPARFPK